MSVINVDFKRKTTSKKKDYFILRYGRYFRPNCQGYTEDIAHAGHYTLEETRGYEEVEGITIRHVSEEILRIERRYTECLDEMKNIRRLRRTLKSL